MHPPTSRIGPACVYSIRSLNFAFAALVLTLASSRAATITWTNTAGGNWNDAANWNPNQVPGASDDALITSDGIYTVTLDVSASIASLTLGGASGKQTLNNSGNTLTLTNASTVGANGELGLSSGMLNASGLLTVRGVFNWTGGTIAGAVTIVANGTMNISGNNNHDLPNCALTNNGAVVWSDGTIRGGGNPGTQISNFGLWTVQTDMDINTDFDAFGVTFNNTGTFRKSAGTGNTTIQGSVVFTDTGTVDVQSGTLVLNSGGTFSSSSVISGGGSVSLQSGAFTLNGIITSPNVQEVGGTLVGTNVINGVLTWANGTWNNASSVTIASNGVLNIVSAFDHDLPSCALTNYGTVVWSAGRVRGGGNPGTPIYNFGLWDAKSDQELNGDYGGFGVTFNNTGTFRKSTGTGSTTIQTASPSTTPARWTC